MVARGSKRSFPGKVGWPLFAPPPSEPGATVRRRLGLCGEAVRRRLRGDPCVAGTQDFATQKIGWEGRGVPDDRGERGLRARRSVMPLRLQSESSGTLSRHGDGGWRRANCRADQDGLGRCRGSGRADLGDTGCRYLGPDRHAEQCNAGRPG